jgi:hypothetical protein
MSALLRQRVHVLYSFKTEQRARAFCRYSTEKVSDRGGRPGTTRPSGYTGETIVRQGQLDSGVEFLQKPFTADVLNRRVREVLNR